jgi:Domain of unknown function (DUF4338)
MRYAHQYSPESLCSIGAEEELTAVAKNSTEDSFTGPQPLCEGDASEPSHLVHTARTIRLLRSIDNQAEAAAVLRTAVLDSLAVNGFSLVHDHIVPIGLDKDSIRRLHQGAVNHQVKRARESLARHESQLLHSLAQGKELRPDKVEPIIVPVIRRSKEELLFRWAKLHWSIPTSAGYGRRLRFLVLDGSNDKLMGIIGLGDPVFSLRSRDAWIGWDHTARRDRLSHVLDAFVLGAVPPYSLLLGGKVVASLTTSTEIREAFDRKYGGRRSIIAGRAPQGLALITTTSALGRSSLYNRLRFRERLLFHRLGATLGSGDFHFSDGLYEAVTDFAARFCEPSAKNPAWGTGFRNRREVVRKTLKAIGLSPDLLYHGVRRELYAAPLAANAREFLKGDDDALESYDDRASQLAAHALQRWFLPRSEWDSRYIDFNRDSWRLWPIS